MSQPKIFNYLAAGFIVFLLLLWYWQNRHTIHPPARGFSGPVVVSVKDSKCSAASACPTDNKDCVVRTFKVIKDSLYFFTVRYSKDDSLQSSCYSCGKLFMGDSLLLNKTTECASRSVVQDSIRLKAGVSYKLVVCLMGCAAIESCLCGQEAQADAAISFEPVH